MPARSDAGSAAAEMRPPRRRTLVASLMLLPLGACADGRQGPGSPRQGAIARQVSVAAASACEMRRVVVVTGSLAAEEQALLAFKVPGRLREIAVDLGDRVANGDTIARLDPRDFELRVEQSQAEVRQARARLGLPADGDDDRVDPENTGSVRQARAVLEEARLTRERLAGLWEQRTIARSDLDAAVAIFLVAQAKLQDALEEVSHRQAFLVHKRAELETARAQLADAVLKAPFAGAVRQRIASPGEYLAVGSPVVTLVQLHPLRLRMQVPEREAAQLRAGQNVALTVEGDSTSHVGHVSRLAPAIEERNRTLLVEAEVPNERELLRPGSFARATIMVGTDKEVVCVPDSAVVVFAGIEKVITVRDGRALEKRIVTGRREGGQTEVLEGVARGDPVVIDPGNLTGGQPVIVQ